MTTTQNPKRWMYLFVLIVGLQALGELALGVTILIDLPLALDTGFGINYTPELDILGLALGLYLLLLTSLMVLSIFWTLKGNYSGSVIGIIVGLFLMLFGLSTYLKFGDTQGIMVDGIRGAITALLAYQIGDAQRIKNQV